MIEGHWCNAWLRMLLKIYPTIRSHIFDGVTLSSETAAFQLCDITDPMLKRMIDDEEDIRESCNVGRSG
jgi:hypothetical protein